MNHTRVQLFGCLFKECNLSLPIPTAEQVIKEPGLLDRESLLREVAILKSCRWAVRCW